MNLQFGCEHDFLSHRYKTLMKKIIAFFNKLFLILLVPCFFFAPLCAMEPTKPSDGSQNLDDVENRDPNRGRDGADSPRGKKRKRMQYEEGQQEPQVFSRNHERLTDLADASTPRRKERIRREAIALTPFFRQVYPITHDTDNPENPSPLKQIGSRESKSRKRRKKQDSGTVRRKVRVLARAIFREGEHWDAIIENPSGYTFHQRDGLIDPWHVDTNGRTNLERMLRGNAPIGPDGESVELHHLVQEDPGPLVEVSAELHRRESGVLHTSGPGLGDRREHFNHFRSNVYWPARACDILESEGLYPV